MTQSAETILEIAKTIGSSGGEALFNFFHAVIAAADDLVIAATNQERERCAGVVEADEYNCLVDDPTVWSQTVAAKIRKGVTK